MKIFNHNTDQNFIKKEIENFYPEVMSELENIDCKNCGMIDDFTVVNKSGQYVATCNNCGKFIKNIPYQAPALYFGKYKGKAIKDYDTPDEVNYLHWIRNNPDIWNVKLNQRTRDAINLRLDGLIKQFDEQEVF